MFISVRFSSVLSFALGASLTVSTPAQVPASLTLSDAVAMAAERSPDLAAAAIELRALDARIQQAGARPNPELTVDVENIGGDIAATGGLQSTLQLGQLVELGGKRSARIDEAKAAREIARWDYESRRRELTALVARSFYDALAAQRALELSDEGVGLAEDVARTVSELVEAGKVSPIEQTRAEVALATDRIERERVRSELTSARSRLAATWGAATPAFERVDGELAAPRGIPALDELMARTGNNPDISRRDAEIARREAIVRLERARGTPDLTVAGGYRDFELGSETYVASASIPIPLFNRNRGARLEARERLAIAQEDRRAAEIRVQQAITSAHADLVRADAEVRNLRELVVPGAESVFAAINEGYRLGKFGYMDVLDARSTLATSRMLLARAEADLYRALAEVERLTGSPIDTTTDMTGDGINDGNEAQ